MATCKKCEMTDLVWNETKGGSWYLGIPNRHGFENGNEVITHIAAHNCKPTPDQLARFEAERTERFAVQEAENAKVEKAIAESKAEAAKLHHVQAEIGEKVTIVGTVMAAVGIDTAYGPSNLIAIKGNDYSNVKIFSKAQWTLDTNEGDEIQIVGTVKAHSHYNELPETVLVRAKKI